MMYRAVSAFLIFLITQEASGNFPTFLDRGPSKPDKILGGIGVKCHNDGEEVNLPPVLAIPCMRCICKAGIVVCKKPKCASIENCNGIVVQKPGACCEECQKTSHCIDEGNQYKNGDTWFRDKCKKCTCNEGQLNCVDQVCQTNLQCPKGMRKALKPGACCQSCVEETGMCTSFGDPHYQTFDGRMYNFQGKCKYVFAKDCETNNFSIQVRNEGRHSRTFSWTKSVLVQYKDLEVALLHKLRVKVNGAFVALPYYRQPDLYIAENGYLMTVTTAIGVEVVWDGDSYTEVHVPRRYQNKTCGFCGNFNGDPNDDFKTPSGEVKDNTREFAVSWKVPNNRRPNCDADTRAGHEHDTPPCRGEKLIHARKQCSVFKNSKFARCHGIVPPRPHFQSCVNDMCHCPRSQVHSCLCQSLTAYSRACQRKGLTVKWRSKSICGIKCKGGAIYDDCGPACRLTCHNKDDVNKVCTKPCVAGCQCPAGKVWHKRKCISPSKCPKSKKKNEIRTLR